MTSILKRWKAAATLILVAGSKMQKSQFNYKALMLKRSRKSKFMPSATVFPGGVLDSSDYSNEWLDVFKSAGVKEFSEFTNASGPRPEVMSQTRDSNVPNEVALRICTIRETFEESGILLARKWQHAKTSSTACNMTGKLCDDIELRWWQNKVDGDSAEFLVMCREHSVVPDIWALSEWSNWLTPTEILATVHAGRRYDTMFFISILDTMPETAHCPREMVSAMWYSPLECIELFRAEQLWLAPPQYYELSRLLNFSDIERLDDFHRQRNGFGCERWLPFLLFCEDGRLSLLPGDDRYPKDDTSDVPSTHCTIAESNSGTVKQHCIEITGQHCYKIVVNIKPKFRHVLPVVSLEPMPHSQL